jgi:nucleoid DNA-binding protein
LNKINNTLLNQDWTHLNDTNLNKAVEFFVDSVTAAVDEHAPVKIIQISNKN